MAAESAENLAVQGMDIVILGGGISGLTAGFLLNRKGFKVAVLEQTGHAGGCITTWKKDGFIFELGPNTVLNNSFEIDALCDAAGILDGRLTATPASKRRFIAKGGDLHALPSGPFSFLTTGIFPPSAKLRLLKEPFIPPAPKGTEETIAAFTRRRLGEHFLRYAVGPFVSGVYAGDPEKLSVKHATAKIYALEENYGSLIKGAIAKRKGPAPAGGLFSFTQGLETLPLVLAGEIGRGWHPNTTATAVSRSGDGFVIDGRESAATPVRFSARAVISALPSLAASQVLDPLGGDFSPGIASLPYADVAVVCMGFRRSDIKHRLDGFGFLAPEAENRYVLGCLFQSSLFPGRAPQEHAALTAFVGGAMHPERVAPDSQEILASTLKDLRFLLGLNRDPVLARVEKWQPAIPQYVLGHGAYKTAARVFEEECKGVFISGNLLGGVSVGDCIKNATALADRVGRYLRDS